jgi:thiosulfate/3-mercaptopyruvate sulfurtransferase
MNQKLTFTLSALVLTIAVLTAYAAGQSSTDIPTNALINPAEVATLIQSKAEKPIILQVGSHVLFQQAHIPGSEYVGAGSTAEGRQQLQKRVASLPKDKFIILYCGCCPWEHCPNVKPAYKELHEMGFSNLKVMYIANDFGKDWVEKGFPVSKGD